MTSRWWEEGSKLTAASVGSGRADLGLVMLPVDEPYRFESKTLLSNVCSLVVSRHHPFAQMSSVHIKDLKDETILTYSETATLHDTFIRMCGEWGFAPRIAYKSLMTRFLSQNGGHAAMRRRSSPVHPPA